MLRCMRHEQIHWMIKRRFPQVRPEKIMRQLRHVLSIYDNGEYYLWPGTEPCPDRAAAVDVMLMLCKNNLPMIGAAPHLPSALLFFVPTADPDTMLAYRVYTPRAGKEYDCRMMAEGKLRPRGHAVVFVIGERSQVSLLRVSHPHIFALATGGGKYEFIEARV